MSAARRVVIADDEPFARERLRMLLQAHPAWTIVAECEHGLGAVDAIVAHQPDLVFLDIRMPELDGIEVVQALDAQPNGGRTRIPAIVFVTAHESYAVKAFEVRALDYLLKPVDPERLARTIDVIERRFADGHPTYEREMRAFLTALREGQGYPRRFLVRDSRGGLYFVRADEIEWVEARENYVRLHGGGRTHLIRDTMRSFEAKLDPATFVRAHRSAIVSLDHVRRLEPYARGEYLVVLKDGTQLRTSRTYGAKLHALLE